MKPSAVQVVAVCWLLLVLDMPMGTAGSACTAADSALGLTKNSAYGFYYVASNAVLAKICARCDSLDLPLRSLAG
jgi:hypothetical protein